jgi:hypothetical protein
MPDGTVGWIRMSGKRPPSCQCGVLATRECDWKLKSSDTPPPPMIGRARTRRVRTCDTPLCGACAWSPAPDKDLCPTHAAEWRARLEAYRSIDQYAEWCRKNRPAIRRVAVALTERYTRTILGLRVKDPLYWKGLELHCIGSPAVRERRDRFGFRERPETRIVEAA